MKRYRVTVFIDGVGQEFKVSAVDEADAKATTIRYLHNECMDYDNDDFIVEEQP